MHSGRIAIAIGLVGCVACGLAFAPGEYAESAPIAALDAPVDTHDAVAPNDAGPADVAVPGTRILVFAGRRDPVPGEPSSISVAETMRTTLSPSGELGPWTFDVPPPQSTSWSRAFVAGDALFLQSSSVFLTTTLVDGDLGPEWRPLSTRSMPAGFMRPWIVSDAGITAAGGQSSGNFTTNVFVASFLPDGGVGDWTSVSSKLVKARGDVTLLRYGDFLYAIGGRDSSFSGTSGRDEVEVARFGADGTLGAFAATTNLANPSSDAASFGILLPIVAAGAGHVFVLGGQRTASGGSPSDVALAAKVDETTGQLGAWISLPRLPAAMTGAAAVVVGNTVVVFGGNLGDNASDSVLALSIEPSGSFGASWRKIGSLPDARSGLAAVVY